MIKSPQSIRKYKTIKMYKWQCGTTFKITTKIPELIQNDIDLDLRQHNWLKVIDATDIFFCSNSHIITVNTNWLTCEFPVHFLIWSDMCSDAGFVLDMHTYTDCGLLSSESETWESEEWGESMPSSSSSSSSFLILLLGGLALSCSALSSLCWSTTCCFLHFILLFWNQVFTCVSLSSNRLASSILSGTERYFFSANLVSSPSNCFSVNTVLSLRFLFILHRLSKCAALPGKWSANKQNKWLILLLENYLKMCLLVLFFPCILQLFFRCRYMILSTVIV